MAYTATKRLRVERGLTQEQLAERAGVAVRTLQRAEAGQPVQAEVAQAIAGALEVAITALWEPSDADMQAAQRHLREPGALILSRLSSGSVLADLLSGCHAMRQSRDEANTDAGRTAQREFLAALGDALDLANSLGPAQMMDLADYLGSCIAALESTGLRVYAARRKGTMKFPAAVIASATCNGGVSDQAMPWNELVLFVTSANSDRITKTANGEVDFMFVNVAD